MKALYALCLSLAAFAFRPFRAGGAEVFVL